MSAINLMAAALREAKRLSADGKSYQQYLDSKRELYTVSEGQWNRFVREAPVK